jgi:hypothetical protein
VKRSRTRQSANTTPTIHKFTIGAGGIPVAMVSSTVITLPAAVLLLHRESPALRLTVGLLPSLPYLLLAVAFVAVYIVSSLLAIVGTAIRIASHTEDLDCYLEDMFRWITNPPVAFLTLDLLKPRNRRSGSLAAPVPPLPAGRPGAARKQDTPVYWEAFQEMATRSGGAPDLVSADDVITEPIQAVHGRHARLGSRVSKVNEAHAGKQALGVR